MALDTVQQYIDRARALLLDQIEEYRYDTESLVQALNMAILEIRRLRPDIVRSYFRTELPEFSAIAPDAVVPIDPQYRVACLYYMCGHVQLRDEENTQDTRAAVFLSKFQAQLISIQG